MPSGKSSRLSQLILLTDSLTTTLVWESPGLLSMSLPFPRAKASAGLAVEQVLAYFDARTSPADSHTASSRPR